VVRHCFLAVHNQQICLAVSGQREIFHLEDLSLLGAFVKSHKLFGASCTSYLSMKDFQLLKTKRPRVAQNELIEALKWQEESRFSQPADKLIVDYLDIPASSQAEEVFAIAISRDYLEGYQDGLELAGLQSSVISISPLAYSQYLKNKFSTYPVVVWINLFDGAQVANAYHNGELVESIRLPSFNKGWDAGSGDMLKRIYEEKLANTSKNICWVVNSLDVELLNKIKQDLPGDVMGSPLLESEWRQVAQPSWTALSSDVVFGVLGHA
jgi:hypothetical protein